MAQQTRLSFTTSVIMINRCDRRWSPNAAIIVLLQRWETAVEYDLLSGAARFVVDFPEGNAHDDDSYKNVV